MRQTEPLFEQKSINYSPVMGVLSSD